MVQRPHDFRAAHVAEVLVQRLAAGGDTTVGQHGERHLLDAFREPIAIAEGNLEFRESREARLRGPGERELTLLVVVLDRVPSELEGRARLAAGYRLTSRELEVATLVMRRLSNAEIAAALGISIHTARHHLERLVRKLGVRTRGEAVRLMESASRG
jgi:DNA-binding CsgD family transcriptional regulator